MSYKFLSLIKKPKGSDFAIMTTFAVLLYRGNLSQFSDGKPTATKVLRQKKSLTILEA